MQIKITGEVELARFEDEYGAIVVTQSSDIRAMNFASSLQQSSVLMSCPSRLIHEYTQIMLLAMVFSRANKGMLLGLGGGGLVHCLSHYFPELSLQVVELRQAVIEAAQQYFDLPRSAKLTVACGDAFEQINKVQPASMDLIFSDLYEAHGMSELQLQIDFIAACYGGLRHNNGWLAINFHVLPDSRSALMQAIVSMFCEVWVCDVFKGNWVLFCGKQPDDIGLPLIKSGIKALADTTGLPLVYYFKHLARVWA